MKYQVIRFKGEEIIIESRPLKTVSAAERKIKHLEKLYGNIEHKFHIHERPDL